VAFNAARNPKEKMEEFLAKWVKTLEEACKDGKVFESGF
jgi:hypothetical protein